MAGKRPIGVTIVAVLAWLSGLLSILGGVILLITGNDGEGTARGAVIAGAVIAIIIGVITIIVSLGLFRGRNGARVVTTIVFAFNVATAVFHMFAGTQSLWAAVVSAALAIIGIVLLWTKSAGAFFGGRSASAPV